MHPTQSGYDETKIPEKVLTARNLGVSIIRIDIHWSWFEGGEEKPSSWNYDQVTRLESFLNEVSGTNVKSSGIRHEYTLLGVIQPR